MKVIGIIAEYNPFHNGHKYQIEESKKALDADFIVCVMSGNYIQRGEPAVIDKWLRTKSALLNGVDLVIELPTSYVLQSAEFFAYAGIKILDSLNIVDYISFGSESGNIDDFLTISRILCNEPKELSDKIKKYSQAGNSFPVAREKAILQYLNNKGIMLSDNDFIKKPNNILGIEYIKALINLESNIKPITIKRYKAGYNSTDIQGNIASATAIRKAISDNTIENISNVMPQSSFDILKQEISDGYYIHSIEDFKTSIFTLISRMDNIEVKKFPEVKEGLQNRIIQSLNYSNSLEEYIECINTKRYTRTRIQRIIFNMLLNITQEKISLFNSKGGPQYIRILGMNNKGKELIKIAKEKATLPIITKPASFYELHDEVINKMINIDFTATDIYHLHMNKKNIFNIDYKTSPIVL